MGSSGWETAHEASRRVAHHRTMTCFRKTGDGAVEKDRVWALIRSCTGLGLGWDPKVETFPKLVRFRKPHLRIKEMATTSEAKTTYSNKWDDIQKVSYFRNNESKAMRL